MFLTPILYIALGFSLGVGITLIFLQERFVRERRKLLALAGAEKAKAQQMLKDLDAKWEQETADGKEEVAEARHALADLEEQARSWEQKSVELEEQIAAHDANPAEVTEGYGEDERHDLEASLLSKQEEISGLQKEIKKLSKSFAEAGQELSELHAEIDFLKGNIANLEAEKEESDQGDDYFVLTPSHVIPGSVARALMNKDK